MIVEVNEHLPKVHGGYDECIHISDVDYIVEGEHAPFAGSGAILPTETDRKIAEKILPYLVMVRRYSLASAVCQMHWVS